MDTSQKKGLGRALKCPCDNEGDLCFRQQGISGLTLEVGMEEDCHES